MADSERTSKRRDEISPVGSKKMKIQIDELNLPSDDHRNFSALSPDKKLSPVTTSNSGELLPGGILSGDGDTVACRSFSIESNVLQKDDSLRAVDLEAKSFETESSSCIDNKTSRDTTPSSRDTDDMDSTAEQQSSEDEQARLQAEERRNSRREAVEKFFEEAEKEMREKRQQFMEKYNFDIENEVPLEGRYEWVPLKPLQNED
ncbi:Cyclin-dependent kinase inhibitor family protein [Euphorbia peplus]|nr:Cyclin-dependent kinase inhibitor family protein [Euphorbia peplus]